MKGIKSAMLSALIENAEDLRECVKDARDFWAEGDSIQEAVMAGQNYHELSFKVSNFLDSLINNVRQMEMECRMALEDAKNYKAQFEQLKNRLNASTAINLAREVTHKQEIATLTQANEELRLQVELLQVPGRGTW